MKMTIERKIFPLTAPFVITGYVFKETKAIWVKLEEDGFVGRGEAIGVYYTNETADSMVAQLESVAGAIEAGISLNDVQGLLPSGGARNALDCALWDLEAKKSNTSVWDRLGISAKPLVSVATIGIESPQAMALAARNFAQYPNLKIKLSGDDPIARLEAIRVARPEAKLIVDVNQGWSFGELKEYIPAAQRLNIAMIEQPLPRGGDHELDGFKSPVPLGADESCLDLADYETVSKRYDVINIKLDKCGGLSEGLEIVKCAERDGKGLMVGNMTGSSLSMAPAYVIGQFCQFVDIDGPLFLKQDIDDALSYVHGGIVSVPTPALWG